MQGRLTKAQVRALELLQASPFRRCVDGWVAESGVPGSWVALPTMAALRRKRLVVRSRNHARCWISVRAGAQ